jgi:phosphate transport system substrate-binding protein
MFLSTRALRRSLTASAVAATLVVAPVLTAIAQALDLNGAGATFPAPLYQRYFNDFRQTSNINVNYQAVGSGAGIRQLIAGTVDFGGSDAAMTDEEIQQVARGVLLVPTAGGAVSIVYNLPGVSSLKLSRTTLPAIFSGQITRWNDPKIAADNPGVKLPDQPIRPVVRAEGSGTTFIFTNHLSAIDSYFKGKVGASTTPNWTVDPVKGKGNAGVAAEVQRTAGAIGYVEYSYAKANNLPSASIQNKKGEFVAPSVQTAEAALATLKFPTNFRVFVNDPDAGYPIAGLTWIMVYKKYPTREQADAVKKLVQWMLTDGQKINNSLDYTRIPESVAQRAIQAVSSGVTVGQ